MNLFPMIGKFGVELEGGWNRPFPRHYLFDGSPRANASEDCECGDCGDCDECEFYHSEHDGDECEGRYLHGDGSVTVRADYVGEIATPPYESWNKFVSDYNAVYPDHINRSCGMHLHISVNAEMGDPVALYGSMMTQRFERFILRGMKRWGSAAGVRRGSAFWTRIAGDNEYCRPIWCPDTQAREQGHGSSRYSRLNFAWACNERNTLEYRFLPMFECKELGEHAIRNLLRLSNRYLVNVSKTRFDAASVSEEIEIPDDGVDKIDLIHLAIGAKEEGTL